MQPIFNAAVMAEIVTVCLGCDLPGGWERSTHHFVLFDLVVEHSSGMHVFTYSTLSPFVGQITHWSIILRRSVFAFVK